MLARHLGARVSEVVDDQLVGAERRRALGHLAGCNTCRAAVNQERQARRAAATLREIGMPSGLTDRIVALAGPGAGSGEGAETSAAPPWAPTGARVRPRVQPRAVLATAAAASVAGIAAVSGLYALGAPPGYSPEALTRVDSPTLAASSVGGLGSVVSLGSVGGAGSARDVANGDDAAPAQPPAAREWPGGFLAPHLPAGASLQAAREVAPGVVAVSLDLAGTPVDVVAAHGRLDAPSGPARDVGGHAAYEVEGWWLAQVGTDVVAVRGDEASAAAVLGSFATRPGGWGEWSSRVAAGWRVVTDG